MDRIKKIALLVILVSIVLGSGLGLLVQENHPSDQIFSFTATALHAPEPIGCNSSSPIPGNYSDWLVISVIGNRTGLGLISTTVVGNGGKIQLTMPLNESQSAFVSYRPINRSLEIVDVPIASYWSPGANLDVTLSYQISGYAPTSFIVGSVAVVAAKNFSC